MHSKIFGRVVAIAAFLSALASSTRPTSAGTITFSDGTFNAGDWSNGVVVESTGSAGATQSAQQMLAGGNPGAYWQFTTSMPADSAPFLVFQEGYFNNAAIYNPSVSGAITGMIGGLNLSAINPDGGQVAGGLLLMQNGIMYDCKRPCDPIRRMGEI